MSERVEAGLSDRLQQGIEQLGLEITAEQLTALVTFLKLLEKWNTAFNLSGITDPHQMVSRHILDSLAISPYLSGKSILDMGTGAGFPGIPLALLNQDMEFILLDSNSKKTRFLFQVKLALELDNVTVENSRVEHYQCQKQIDIVVSRAFGSLAKLVELSSMATGGKGVLLAMKGTYPEEEIVQLQTGFAVSRSISLKVPGIDESRYLIEIPLQVSN